MDCLKHAIDAARSGQLDKALVLLSEAVSRPATQTDGLGHRAWLLKSLGRFEESLSDYDRLLELLPGEREALRQRADTLRRLGRLNEALTELLQLLQSDPLDRAASRILAETQEAAGAIETPAFRDLPAGPPPPARPLNPVIDALERDTRNFPASVFPETGRFLYSVVRLVRPALVVETGCYVGYSTLCIAQAMEDNGCGHVHSFDLFTPDSPVESPVIGPCSSTYQAARAHVEASGLSSRVTLHSGKSAEEIVRHFSESGKAGTEHPIDLAFIDGDHTLRGCLADFFAIDPLLKPGGILLLHDTVPENCHWAGPRYLLESLPSKSRQQYQCVNLPTGEGLGYGILQKAGAPVTGPWRPSVIELLAERLLRSRWRKTV